ncbi:hypothetical protein GN956_G24731 [Arapaima gigas]
MNCKGTGEKRNAKTPGLSASEACGCERAMEDYPQTRANFRSKMSQSAATENLCKWNFSLCHCITICRPMSTCSSSQESSRCSQIVDVYEQGRRGPRLTSVKRGGGYDVEFMGGKSFLQLLGLADQLAEFGWIDRLEKYAFGSTHHTCASALAAT